MNSKYKRRALGLLMPAAMMLFAQCDDVLETQPFGSLNTGTFYKSAKDFESATIGAYSTLQNLTYAPGGASLFHQGLLPDDDTRAGGTNSDNDFTWTSTNGNISYIYNVSYRGVLRSNLILQQLEQTDQLTPAQKARFEGEAKFVRAYFNFLLAKFFGTPPVITQVAKTVEETRPGNSAPGEIWDLIESDLEASIKGLAGLRLENGRASEWAARALLGKVEITRAQWGVKDAAILKGVTPQAKYREAETHLQEVVNSGRFRLVNFEDNFKYTTENNQESLFEMQASFGTDINGWAATDENGGGASSGTGRPIVTGAGSFNGINAPGGGDWGYGSIIVTQSLVDSFEKYDSANVTIPGQTVQTNAVVRDPRAYFTFYSTGERYGRACGTNPAIYNFDWNRGCPGGQVVVVRQANWSLTGVTAAKYVRPFENFSGGGQLNQSVSQNNERLIRYADVLLLLAEAKLLGRGDVAGAAAHINEVRERARNAYERAYGAQSIDAALYTQVPRPANLLPARPANVSTTQMFGWLMQERRNELAMEMHRYDDLVRWLRAGLITKDNINFGDDISQQRFNPEIHYIRPFPLGELDLNKNLKQNPGY